MKLTLFFACLAATCANAASIDLVSLNRAGLVSPEILKQHASELSFTADQETSLQSLAEEAKPRLAELETAVRDEQQKLESLVKESQAEPAPAAAQLDKLLAAEAALKHFQLAKLLELRAILTPEQRTLALALARKGSMARQPVDSRLKRKAQSLKAAWEELGVEPPESLTAKGAEIEQLARDGKYEEADQALDVLIEEVGLNLPTNTDTPDFSKFEPGSTDLGTLKERYDAVTLRAKEVTRLPTIRLLLKGRDELEKAKAAEDAEQVARILTWAEGVLSKEPSSGSK